MSSVYFHEYVHFLQSIGTTYGISRHFEILEWIAKGVRQMGGSDALILSGLSKAPKDARKDLRGHRLMEGAYGSRKVDLPIESRDIGLLAANENTACYEYIRWNFRDKCYFATPVGRYTLCENLAALSETIGISDKARIPIVRQHLASSDSPLHNYTVGTEFFWNTYEQQQKNPDSLIVTAIAFMDACQQIPSWRHSSHPEWVPMTSPSIRFAVLTDALGSVRFINHLHDPDYDRFITDLFKKAGWPAPPQFFREHLEWLSGVAQNHLDSLESYRLQHPELHEAYFRNQVEMARRNLQEIYGATHSRKKLEARLAKYEKALRSDQFVAYGKFGLGLLDYIIRAMKIRLEHPLWLVFPQGHLDELRSELPLPIYWHGKNEVNAPSARTMALFFDIKASHHLWALTVQWFSRKRKEKHKGFSCGYRYFGMECPEPPCKNGRCPNWSPDSPAPDFNCTFVGVTKYFRLWRS